MLMSNTPKKDRAWQIVQRDKPEYANKSAGYLARVRYAMRRAEQGLCAYAGCPKKVRGMCDEHRKRAYANRRAWYQRNKEGVSK